MNNKVLITNIQRFSLHDGPGIRTTVFLKGCSLRCPWCCNPECQSMDPQSFYKDGRLLVYGKWYDVDEVVDACIKDKAFYESGDNYTDWRISCAAEIERLPGGITFSGGEALLQMPYLAPICDRLHELGIHLCVETSLYAPEEYLSLALQKIDLFYVDIKILDAIKCQKIENGDISSYLTNLKILMESNCPIIIRIPVIGNMTDDATNQSMICTLLENYKKRVIKIELLKEHGLGESKYKTLGMAFSYCGVSDSVMVSYKNALEKLRIPVEICKI